MPLYRRTYDATGKPTGTVEYSFGRAPRKRIGCLGWTFIAVFGSFFLLWPLSLEPRTLTAGAAWAVTVGWWCLLAVVPLAAWARPKAREHNRRRRASRHERERKARELGGRPAVDLREAGQAGL